MTGQKHYAEAERLVAVARGGSAAERYPGTRVVDNVAALLAEAQVHATLALVAATVASRITTPQQQWGGVEHHIEDTTWSEVIG